MKDIEIKKEHNKFKFRVSAIIIKNNKILLEKAKKYDGYCFPGGHVELGETTVEAIFRECLEELMFVVKKAKLFCAVESIYNTNDDVTVQELNYFYKVKVDAKIKNELFDVIEIDKGVEKKHRFEWIPINKLNDICLQPLVVRDLLINKSNEKVILIDNR